MFGTVGIAHVRPENREKLLASMEQYRDIQIPGFRMSYVMFPENHENEVVIAALFEDADSYWKNAQAPAQDARYREMRALLEDDPVWHDGEWLEY